MKLTFAAAAALISSQLLTPVSAQDADNSAAPKADTPPCHLSAAAPIKTDTNEVTLLSAYQTAMPIERKDPRYPIIAARSGYEGWVKLSFEVDETGKVVAPFVVDNGGHSSFKSSALSAIEKWTYKPAIKDGKQVKQCNMMVQMNYAMGGQKGASRSFIRKYKKLVKHLENNELEAANAMLTVLHDSDERNRYENAWMYSVSARYAAMMGDERGELSNIKRTIASSVTHERGMETFDAPYILWLTQRQLQLEANLGLYVDSLKTATNLLEKDLPDNTRTSVNNMVQKIEQVLSSDNAFSVQGDLQDQDFFMYNLARNRFGFASITGQLDSIEVRCDAQRATYTVAQDSIWSIPASWGACSVLIKGEEHTQFELVELATI